MRKGPTQGTTPGMDDLAMLLLQMDWGADEALEDAPLDRLRPMAAPRSTAPVAQPITRQAANITTPAEDALKAAAQADSLEALKAAIAGFSGCALKEMATSLVFASGDASAGVMVIGGAPGAEDDRSGAPFSGPDGVLLDAMLASVGLSRASMLLTPVLPWRPPGGRVPAPAELQLCRPFLARLIQLASPGRLVMFGALAAGTVLGSGPRPRGIAWVDTAIDGTPRRVLVLPGLTEIARTATRRREAWAGMRALKRELG